MEQGKTSSNPDDFESSPAEASIGDFDSSTEIITGNPGSSDVGKSTGGSGSPTGSVAESVSDSSGVHVSAGCTDSSTERNVVNPDPLDLGKGAGDSQLLIGENADPASTYAGKSTDGTGLDLNAVQQVVSYALKVAAERNTKVSSQEVPTGDPESREDSAKIENDQKSASELLKLAFDRLNTGTVPPEMPKKKEGSANKETGPGYTVEDMRRLQTIFAEQAFNFLLKNYEVFKYHPTFARELPVVDSECYKMCFTYEVGQSLVLMAYINRIGYWKTFRRVIINNLGDYMRVASSIVIQKDKGYFCDFLNWVAFTVELTVFCLRRGHDFIEIGKAYIGDYSDLEYFHSQGGWGSLMEQCCYLSDVYDRLSIVVSHERPTDEYLMPFMKMVGMMERDAHARRQKWFLSQPEMRTVRQIRYKLLRKYQVLDELDKLNITSGFMVKKRECPLEGDGPLEETCPAAVELMKNVGFEKRPQKVKEEKELERLAAVLESTRIKDEAGEPEFISAKKYEFLVSDRFMERWEKKKGSPSRQGRNRRIPKADLIRLTSPTKQAAGVSSTALGEKLEESLESKNFLEVGNDFYLVAPSESEAEDTITVLLDTDSEEEDDDDDKMSVAERMRVVNEQLRKLVMWNAAQMAEHLFGQGYLPSDLPGLSSDAPFNPTPDTGAIPKQPRQRKASRRKTITSPEKGGKDSTDSGNVPEYPSNSNEKSPRRRKKK